MRIIRKIIKALLPKPILRHILLLRNAKQLRKNYFGRQLRIMKPLIMATGETHNFTYDLREENLRYLAETVAVATGKTAAEIEGFIHEAISDEALRFYFDARMEKYDGQKSPKNLKSPFGRRLGWYAIARAIKPRVVIETGVERGHGALLLCAALLRNECEGSPGRYFGTDINPDAGWLLSEPYSSVGKFLIGDSITSLQSFGEPIDLFINDSDHSADYEASEYETIKPLLSSIAIVLGDNSHSTDKLARFSRTNGRRFLMFYEKPKDHWYPGAGLGISFP